MLRERQNEKSHTSSRRYQVFFSVGILGNPWLDCTVASAAWNMADPPGFGFVFWIGIFLVVLSFSSSFISEVYMAEIGLVVAFYEN